MAAPTSSTRTRADRFREHREKNTKLIRYLISGSYESGATEAEKRVLRRQAKNYVYDEAKDELYYPGSKPESKKKVVMQEEEALDLIKLYHSPVTGGHSGINATLSKISMWYTWNGMKQDITEFIKSCDCGQRYDNIKTQAPELKVIKTREPLQLVGMDLTDASRLKYPPGNQPQRSVFTMEEVGEGFRGEVNLAAVCQMTATEDKAANYRAGSYLVERAAKMGAKMVFLPEGVDYIATSPEESVSLAEPLSGKTVTGYAELAKRLGLWISLGGIHQTGPVQGVGDKIYCSHVLLNPAGEIASVYHKAHLFGAQIEGRMNLQESSSVLPGQEMSTVVDTPLGKVAPMVAPRQCYDVRFPEMSTALTQQGAQILTYPSAFTQLTGMAHWEVLLRSRAIENQCYVIAAAQSGKHNDKRVSYGRAMIIDPWGCIVACCHDGLDVAVADIDLGYLQKVRSEMPIMEHRRPDLYGFLGGGTGKPATGRDT